MKKGNITLYHYTTLEAAMGILSKENLCFWGTRYDSMNDPRDYLYAKNIIIPALKESIRDLPNLKEENTENTELYPYIVSFSMEKDYINMWRLYHAEVAIGVDASKLRCYDPDKYIVRKCEYVNENNVHQKFIDMFNNSSEQCDEILMTAREQIMFIKNEEYKIEKEYRLCQCDAEGFTATGPNDFCVHEIPCDIFFKCVRDGDIVLYKKFYICKEALKSITVHTFDDKSFTNVKKHLELWLISQEYDIKNIEIKKTESFPFKDI